MTEETNAPAAAAATPEAPKEPTLEDKIAMSKDGLFACNDIVAILRLGTFPGSEAARVANAIFYLQRQGKAAADQLALLEADTKRKKKALKLPKKNLKVATEEKADGEAS